MALLFIEVLFFNYSQSLLVVLKNKNRIYLIIVEKMFVLLVVLVQIYLLYIDGCCKVQLFNNLCVIVFVLKNEDYICQQKSYTNDQFKTIFSWLFINE